MLKQQKIDFERASTSLFDNPLEPGLVSIANPLISLILTWFQASAFAFIKSNLLVTLRGGMNLEQKRDALAIVLYTVGEWATTESEG